MSVVDDVVVEEELSCMLLGLLDTTQEYSEITGWEGRELVGRLLPPSPPRPPLLLALYPNLDLDLKSARLRIIGILPCLICVVSFALEEKEELAQKYECNK